MEKKFIGYCGIYCENCAVMAKVEPAARVLYDEMRAAGFEEFIRLIPGGAEFWPFLESITVDGICVSCRDGSGYPGCEVRPCAREKGVLTCPLCGDYPCEKFKAFAEPYPVLAGDNALLREKGLEVWGNMQDARRAEGFSYSDAL